MKYLLLSLLSLLLLAAGAEAKPSVGRGYPPDATSINVYFPQGDTTDSEEIAVFGYCSVRFSQAGGDDVSLYAIDDPADPTSAGTLIASFTASTTSATTFTAGTLWVKAKATDATTGGSTLVLDCAHLSGSGSQEPNQSSYAAGASVNAITATISNPSSTKMGAGVTFGNPASFTATPGNEPDNIMGWFYNLDGPNASTPVDPYEHAFNDSYETAYRETTGTGNHTWLERNYDIQPPDLTVTLSSIHANFNPAVGETVYFSSGGQGRVISWSSPTLVWRQDYGTTGVGQTVYDDDGNPSETATLGTPSRVGTAFRTYQWEYDTLDGDSNYAWFALSGDHTGAPWYEQDDLGAALRISSSILNGRRKPAVAINANPYTSDTFTVQDSALFNNPIMTIRYRSAGLDNLDAAVGTDDGWGGGAYWGLRIDQDWSATNTDFQSPGAIYIASPSALGSGSSIVRPQGIHIANMTGRGTTGNPAIFIAEQKCSGTSACTTGLFGNITFDGGTWNTGHLSFGATADYFDGDADHLFRDDTNEVTRVSTDHDPLSETDGNPIVTGSGSTVHGPAFWAISDAGSFDTGNEVCSASGRALTCQDVLEFATPATPTDSTCTATHASAVKFIAFCY